MKAQSAEWATATEKDREDLEAGFREQVIQELEVRLPCDLEVLLENQPGDITLDDPLIDTFGFDVLQTYLQYVGKGDKVHRIPADHYHRQRFELMAMT